MKRENPPFPGVPFALLLVEGADEVRLCQSLLPLAHARELVCWNVRGRSFDTIAANAAKQPNWEHVAHVGIVLDAEEDPIGSLAVAHGGLKAMGISAAPPHAVHVPGPPAAGVFVLPDGAAKGAGEALLRQAAAKTLLASCADAFELCAKVSSGTTAQRNKSWIQAYLAHSGDGGCRVHDAVHEGSWFDFAHAVFDPLRGFLAVLVT